MLTDILWRFLILETFVIGIISANCPNFHLQTQYCDNEIVFIARRPKTVNKRGPYRMRIVTIFKGKRLLQSISKGSMVNVETDVDFKKMTEKHLPGRKLVVFGKKKDGTVYAGKCLRFFPRRWLTQYQKNGLRGNYKQGCDCIGRIDKDYGNMRCEYQFGTLLKTDGTCRWQIGECPEFYSYQV